MSGSRKSIAILQFLLNIKRKMFNEIKNKLHPKPNIFKLERRTIKLPL